MAFMRASRWASCTSSTPSDAGSLGIQLKHLPNNLFREHVALHFVATLHGPEQVTVHHAGGAGPGVNCDLHPGRPRHRAYSVVLAHEVYYAPPPVALLDVAHRERRHLGPAQRAAEQHGDDGTVA